MNIGWFLATSLTDTCNFQTCTDGTDCTCEWDTHCLCITGVPATDDNCCPKGLASGLCPEPKKLDNATLECAADPGIVLCVNAEGVLSTHCGRCPLDTSAPVLGPAVMS